MMNLDVSAVIRQKQVPWRTQWMARKTGSGEERGLGSWMCKRFVLSLLSVAHFKLWERSGRSNLVLDPFWLDYIVYCTFAFPVPFQSRKARFNYLFSKNSVIVVSFVKTAQPSLWGSLFSLLRNPLGVIGQALCRKHPTKKAALRGPFLESPGNVSGTKSNIQIEI